MGGWKETCLTRLAAWRKGWNQALVGGETYVVWQVRFWEAGMKFAWTARAGSFCEGGATLWYDAVDEVEETDERDEQEEKTEPLSELELPDEVEYWG
jgi:hypothetical protein